MRTHITLFLFLAIIGFAAVGLLYIFDVKTGEEAFELLLKTEGGILLLGGCSVLISVLLGGANKRSQD
jgi:hypothetical protein